MKKILLFTILMAIGISLLMAQAPQAFKYQAVVRDLNGSVIADQNINLRISILFGGIAGDVVYSETHPATTNGMGLVNLEIGRGFNPDGSISEINWAAGDYYVKIEMDENGGSNFEPMGVAQLLSVPYALHAITAEGIAGETDGVPANNWILFGNSNTNPVEDKLGTTDAADLVIVTDDMERMRVLSDGDIKILNSAEVGLNLEVKQNVNLNTYSGETNNYGPFTVANLSPTLLSGTLTVDLHTDLNSSLNVDGITDLNSAFNVNNGSPSLLTGTLLVNENATFNRHVTLDDPDLGATSPSTGALVVAGGVGIGENLYVGGSAFFDGPLAVTNETESTDPFTGALTVAGGVGIAKRLNVGGATMIENTLGVNGQMTVHANPGGHSEDTYEDYPLLVEGGAQGIAIKVNGNRAGANNYISFWDEDGGGTMWGRIEGQTVGELWSDPEYLLEFGFKASDIITSGVDFVIAGFEVAQAVVQLTAASTSSTACAGLGACVTAPIPSFIISDGLNLVLKIANAVAVGLNLGVAIADEVAFVAFKNAQIGVSYQSGSGDYAEYLPKLSPGEIFTAGEIVGIKNGFVTKSILGADKVMVVSTSPIVLGNMPRDGNEANYVKIAFMGQVPVKVIGAVNAGDYILPIEFGSGFGKAVHPDKMTAGDYRNIVGVAWSVMDKIGNDISLVNVAVGINSNDLSTLISKQEEEIKALRSEYSQLKNHVDHSNEVLASLVPGYADAIGINAAAVSLEDEHITKEDAHVHQHDDVSIAQTGADDILYFEISREQVETSLEMARETYAQMVADAGDFSSLVLDEKTNAYMNDKGMYMMPLEEHPFWQKIDNDPGYREEVLKYMQNSLEKAFHTHKKYADKFTDFQLHE